MSYRYLIVKTQSGSEYHFSINEDSREGFQDSVEVLRKGKPFLEPLFGKHHYIQNDTFYLIEGEFIEPEEGKSMILHIEDTEPIETTPVTEVIDHSEEANLERFLDP